MSNVEVFDVTVSQLEQFENVAYEDLSDFDCLGKYIVVTTWSWFGQQPMSMMVDCEPVADKENALRYANGLDAQDLMANRMGISSSGNHYEVWHVVEDSTPTLSMDDYEDEGDTSRYMLDEGLRQCRAAYEYVRAIDELF